mmetsp:Transcript_8181/g.22779  ORF Transcript_8181/g.22779 Transcript_8181/m.22779 type:complete len:249 (-) Transcript_8181:197-943(-)
MMRRACTAFFPMLVFLSSANAFVPSPTSSQKVAAATRAGVLVHVRVGSGLFAIDPKISELKEKNSNILEATWSGGAFASMEEEASAIASKLRSAKDLGWTGPPLRRGNTRPRHRAYGGTTELPIQDKPNYDPSSDNCVERWLSLEDFYVRVKESGPAADTVFVALAGGRSCVERDVAEKLIDEWRSGPRGAFDESKFLASVKKGRADLAIGWAGFAAANFFFASCIVFPTNPAAKALEQALANIQSMI